MTDDPDWSDEDEERAQADLIAVLEGNDYQAFFRMCRDQAKFKEFAETVELIGSKAMEPYLAEGRTRALAKAKNGDMSEISELIIMGTILNKDEREYVASVLQSSRVACRGAPKKHDKPQAISRAFFWLSEVDREPREAAVSKCEEIFGNTRSTIEKRLKEGRACKITQERLAMYRRIVTFSEKTTANVFKRLDLKSD